MPHVAALYRYPVKGFTPERCERLAILPEGRVAGDRVLGLRFANSPFPDEAWSRKYEFVALVNTPGLARLALRYDGQALRLEIREAGAIVVEGGLDASGRRRIADAVGAFVAQLPENPLSRYPERLPLRLIGDGVAPRYQDNEAGQITLHGRGSLAALAQEVDDPALSELRFRSNIAVEGLEPWEEQSWIGKRLRIGDVDFDVVKPKVRCLATHANPANGERDLSILPTLRRAFMQDEPTFAVGMLTHGRGGEVRLGDEVRVVAPR